MDDDAIPRVRVDGPVPVSLRDRLLIEWVAQAKVGDAFPPPWSDSQTPLASIVRTLIMLEVIDRPDPGASLAAVAQDASVAARAWLEQNPPPPLKPAPEIPRPPWMKNP